MPKDIYRYRITETREVTVYSEDLPSAAEIAQIALDKSKADKVANPETVSDSIRTTNFEIREAY